MATQERLQADMKNSGKIIFCSKILYQNIVKQEKLQANKKILWKSYFCSKILLFLNRKNCKRARGGEDKWAPAAPWVSLRKQGGIQGGIKHKTRIKDWDFGTFWYF